MTTPIDVVHATHLLESIPGTILTYSEQLERVKALIAFVTKLNDALQLQHGANKALREELVRVSDTNKFLSERVRFLEGQVSVLNHWRENAQKE